MIEWTKTGSSIKGRLGRVFVFELVQPRPGALWTARCYLPGLKPERAGIVDLSAAKNEAKLMLRAWLQMTGLRGK